MTGLVVVGSVYNAVVLGEGHFDVGLLAFSFVYLSWGMSYVTEEYRWVPVVSKGVAVVCSLYLGVRLVLELT